jgi:hypothetical protein
MPNPTNFLNHRSYSVVKIEGDSFTIVRLTSMPTSASPKVHQEFDYASLDAVTSQFVQQQTGEIRILIKRTAQGIVEVGEKLISVKAKLGHGRFGDWLKAEFGWSWDTANRFMNVAKNLKHIPHNAEFEFRALYLLAAPSTPEPARKEALARAASGEAISYTAAKTIKQKHTTSPPKPKPEPEPQPQPQPVALTQPTLALASQLPSRPKQEIVAILPRVQPPSVSQTNGVIVTQTAQASQALQSQVHQPDIPGTWWQLAGKHLLYCGDPNSREFSERITQKVSLLLAFPPTSDWQPVIRAKTRIIADEYLPQGKDLRLFEDGLETLLLLYSNLSEIVVSCFLPSPEILSIINRLGSRGILADPDLKRCNAIISDWKKAGVKVERLD